MSGVDFVSRLGKVITPPFDQETIDKATTVVAANADNAKECAELLAMLGLKEG